FFFIVDFLFCFFFFFFFFLKKKTFFVFFGFFVGWELFKREGGGGHRHLAGMEIEKTADILEYLRFGRRARFPRGWACGVRQFRSLLIRLGYSSKKLGKASSLR
ncbi:hypothetical protein, partial [Bradyrhizobium canariense]|uniref:hypothetical protein n=1 Tax=Bradyrhizobium canariense TaxID=255045 RepID=UPI000A25025D